MKVLNFEIEVLILHQNYSTLLIFPMSQFIWTNFLQLAKQKPCNLIVSILVFSRPFYPFHLPLACYCNRQKILLEKCEKFSEACDNFSKHSHLSHWIFNISGATETAIKNHLRDCIVFPLLKYFPSTSALFILLRLVFSDAPFVYGWFQVDFMH